ncbi:hypothetical protein [Microvirga makkahensis]|uniref:Uncharacterized protein n=1 Tax=Microvirga makkahensis TaxID=1128670 RepID=A0A7X3MW21_9HYPH|nr:hypothetical protein [Microvirga makkahensis]MXQ14229.1 hypothetical protein [Microvirga makkahensis]
MDRQKHAPLPKLTEVCTDQAEVLALTITRFIAAGYMTQDAACWDAGHQCAEEALGYVDGPRLVAAMAGVMRALRVERQQPWHSMPASCCRTTRDEIELMAALSQARIANTTALATSMQILTGQDEAPRLTTALRVAAETLASLGPPLTVPPTRSAVPTILH